MTGTWYLSHSDVFHQPSDICMSVMSLTCPLTPKCQRKYARIVKLFAEQTGLTYEQALDFFYKSKTFELISEGVADMHCLSDEYLAEELMIERDKQHS